MSETDLSKRRLRMWLRILGLTRRAESDLRDFLRRDHDTTLPRFDVMAALWRHPDPMTMTELSRWLLVSNGNVTAVVDRLEADGLVTRQPNEADRRTVRVTLTQDGQDRFGDMARAHEAEISRILGALDHDDLTVMRDLLRKLEPEK